MDRLPSNSSDNLSTNRQRAVSNSDKSTGLSKSKATHETDKHSLFPNRPKRAQAMPISIQKAPPDTKEHLEDLPEDDISFSLLAAQADKLYGHEEIFLDEESFKLAQKNKLEKSESVTSQIEEKAAQMPAAHINQAKIQKEFKKAEKTITHANNIRGKNPHVARLIYQKLANDGNTVARLYYAQMLEKGEGGEKNLQDAKFYYDLASRDKKYLENYENLKKSIDNGVKRLKDVQPKAKKEEEVKLGAKGAKKRYAKLKLSSMSFNDFDSLKNSDPYVARLVFKKYANAKHSDTRSDYFQYMYAEMLEKGEGGSEDLAKAHQYYYMAYHNAKANKNELRKVKESKTVIEPEGEINLVNKAQEGLDRVKKRLDIRTSHRSYLDAQTEAKS